MVQSHCGFNSAGSDFRNHLVNCIHHLGFLTCPVDIDIWMKPMVRPEDGFDYYSYVLIYAEDLMTIRHDTKSVLRRIDKYFKLNPSSVGDSGIYVGSKLKNRGLYNGVWA